MKTVGLSLLFFCSLHTFACSILFYVDPKTGKVYAANNEDYWYGEKAYLKIIPGTTTGFAQLWYGWHDFAQGGINAEGLFFDGAATPNQPLVRGYHLPKNNLGDLLLSSCKNVDEAIDYLEKEKIALTTGHLLFGDRSGKAVIIEWVNGEKKITAIQNNYLMMTNYLLHDTAAGNYPCPRHDAMQQEIERLQNSNAVMDLKQVGGVLAKAVQVPVKNEKGRKSGTLYSSFFDITDMQMILVYQLDNRKKLQLDLKKEFAGNTLKTIYLKDI